VVPADGSDEEAYLTHLSEAIRIPTVSRRGEIDPEPFVTMRELIAETYPRFTAATHLEVFGDHTLLFTLSGSNRDAAPFMLMAHQDVVPVEPGTERDWEHPPFSGERVDGFVWGRGALDDKAAMIGILEAVEGLLQEGFEPAATVYLLFGHDEELGGTTGAAAVAEHLGESGVRLAFVLDEGGAVFSGLLPGAPPLALIGVGEKASLNLEISASDEGGHSSMPPQYTAVGRVAAAVAAVEGRRMQPRLEAQRALVRVLSESLSGPRGWLLRNLEWTRPMVERRLSASPITSALIRTTAAATVMRAGDVPNMLPREAKAIVNFRILPGDTVADVLEHVRSVVGDDVRVRVLGDAADPIPVSSTQTAGFAMIASAIGETFPDAPIAPWVVPGQTDSRYMSAIADGVYRFLPLRLERGDLARFHGTNERTAVADAAGVVGFYRRLLASAGGVA
jgi:carboxypeptidase PM20D1